MQISNNLLIEELLNLTEDAIQLVKKFKALPPDQLNWRKSPFEWSILECIEHLSLYGDFYLTEMEKQILANKNNNNETAIFKSGIIGNYFASLMKVKGGAIKKMKSPKDKNPLNSELTITTLDRFLKQQELLKSLLHLAKTVDLAKVKTAISLTNMLKLKLGDTFRFYVYHIERHIFQADRTRQQLYNKNIKEAAK
jgi:hypothetical protein